MMMIIVLQGNLSVSRLNIVYQTPGCVIVIMIVVIGRMRTHPSVVKTILCCVI